MVGARAVDVDRGRVREATVDVVRAEDAGVFVVAVGLFTADRTVLLVAVDGVVFLTGVVAVAVVLLAPEAARSVLAVDAMDSLLGFADRPSRLDSSPEASTEATEGRALCNELVVVAALLVGRLTVDVVVVGRAGGLLNELLVAVAVALVEDVAVGLVALLVPDSRGATGLVSGRLGGTVVLPRMEDVVSSPAVARDDGRLAML